MGQFTSETDEALLQSAMAGNQDAWAELVARYHTAGIRFVRRRIDDPHLAQDLMQNLWVNLVQTVRRELPDRFAAVFWTLLRRRLIDELRRRGRRREVATLDAPVEPGENGSDTLLARHADPGPDPVDVAVRSEEQSLLLRALDRLPDHYRLVIVARQLQDRSNKETARLLLDEGLVADDGNTEKRVENYYYRGLKELKRQLMALGYPGGGGSE